MKVRKRAIRALTLSAAMTIVGATAAQAWTFATTSAPLTVYSAGTLAGKGAGSITSAAWNLGKLNTQLTDNKSNGNRTYIETWGSATIGSYTYTSYAQTGRRADGESWWATMATKDVNGDYINSHYFYVRVCEDLSWSPDFCGNTVGGRI